MKIKELAAKSKEELKSLLDKERSNLLQFRFNVTAGKVKNLKEARQIRKNIAQLLTLLNR
ncbi:MAG: 50S ribosomal protein L29 [Candidatus Niyogibacteria bacterium]|nr:50S ribosomal protein L29 [Candidatus Niyogibacteria bacterium]